MESIEMNHQVIYRYCDASGDVVAGAGNPNGSLHHIAGICNRERNVFGMMPHPERACSSLLGNTDGKQVFAHLFGIA